MFITAALLNGEIIFYLKRSFLAVILGKFVWTIQIVLKALYKIVRGVKLTFSQVL